MDETTDLFWLARVTLEREPHHVQRVLEVALVRVISRHDVQGAWSPRTFPGRGLKAMDEDERSFYRDWPSYDESSMGSSWSGPSTEAGEHWVQLPSNVDALMRFYDPEGLLRDYLKTIAPRHPEEIE